MECQEVFKLMNRYIDGEITPEEEKVLEFHLGRCKACQIEFSQLKEMSEFLSTMEPAHDFTAKVLAKVQVGKRVSFKRWLPRTRTGWVAAAAVFLLCVLTVTPFLGPRAEPQLIISSGQVQTEISQDGEQKLTVKDGEVRVQGLNGMFTAINSNVIFEGTQTAGLNQGLWDRIKTTFIEVYEKVVGWFSDDKD